MKCQRKFCYLYLSNQKYSKITIYNITYGIQELRAYYSYNTKIETFFKAIHIIFVKYL